MTLGRSWPTPDGTEFECPTCDGVLMRSETAEHLLSQSPEEGVMPGQGEDALECRHVICPQCGLELRFMFDTDGNYFIDEVDPDLSAGHWERGSAADPVSGGWRKRIRAEFHRVNQDQ
jgi:hypothetical protein